MPTTRPHHRRSRLGRRLLPAVACLTLTMALLGSVDWGNATAQSDSAATPVTDDPLQEPTATTEPTATQIPVLDPTAGATPTETIGTFNLTRASGPLTELFQIFVHTCPAGYDPVGKPASERNTRCVDVPGHYAITVSDGGSYTSTVTGIQVGPETPFSHFTFVDVPLGPITVTQNVLDGYRTAEAQCWPATPDEDADWVHVPVDAAGTFAWDLTGLQDVPPGPRCTLYNVPIEQTGTVTVAKYTCPAGTTFTDNEALLIEDCGEGASAPIPFTLGTGDGSTVTQPATDRGDGVFVTVFEDVPAGTPLSIEESVPPGFGKPLVFCGFTGTGDYARVPIAGGSTRVEGLRGPGNGFALTCLFFNVPVPDGDGEDTGTVRIGKYFCPDGTERSDDALALSEACTDSAAAVSFEVSDSAGADFHVTTTGSVPQHGEVSGLAFGDVWISEIMPAGYGEPLVFCSDTPADGAGVYEAVPVHEGNSVTWNLRADAGLPLTCLFFNMPTPSDPGNTVTVHKYTCPPGVNPEEDILLGVCAPGGDGIPFDLVDGNGTHPAAVADGVVEWTGVEIGPVGELQIIETLPEGHADPIVVCDGIRMESTNGFVIPNPGEARPFDIACDWFNLVPDDSSLTIVKHTCPEGYDVDAAGADPATDCPDLTDGVTFRLSGPGHDEDGVTGTSGSGQVTFDGLGAGAYTITETVPDGTSTFVSGCSGLAVGAVHPFPLATGDTLGLTIHGGESIACHWFNVPTGDGGALTVITHICTSEVFVSEVDCQVYEAGQEITLSAWDGDSYTAIDTQTTDGAGRITWTGLEPRSYLLDEPGEWCHMQVSIEPDTAINGVVVVAGQENIVKVYTCGAEAGVPGETPTRYPNTGVLAGGIPLASPIAAWEPFTFGAKPAHIATREAPGRGVALVRAGV